MAGYASALLSATEHLKVVADAIGRELSRAEELATIAKCYDEVKAVKEKLGQARKAKEEHIHKLRATMASLKLDLKCPVDEHINLVIKDCVVNHIGKQLSSQLENQAEKHLKLVDMSRRLNDRIIVTHNNTDAKAINATITRKFVNDPVHAVEPISNQVASQRPPGFSRFPSNFTFENLITLSPDAVKEYMSKFNLEESKLKGLEDARLENINRLMTHLGVGYRLNLALPGEPILTCVWD